jgi:hypothetical protein
LGLVDPEPRRQAAWWPSSSRTETKGGGISCHGSRCERKPKYREDSIQKQDLLEYWNEKLKEVWRRADPAEDFDRPVGLGISACPSGHDLQAAALETDSRLSSGFGLAFRPQRDRSLESRGEQAAVSVRRTFRRDNSKIENRFRKRPRRAALTLHGSAPVRLPVSEPAIPRLAVVGGVVSGSAVGILVDAVPTGVGGDACSAACAS